MVDTALEAVLRRDRALVLTALAALTALAWAYTAWLAQSMTMAVELHPWSGMTFALMFVMWTIMMIGMMLPSAAPMILIYARVGRRAMAQGRPLAATGYFATGYLLAWVVFSLAATLGQGALQRSLLLSPMMMSASAVFSGLVLIAAGVFQWTPFKNACLQHCQSPLVFIQRHGGFRREPRGSLAIGFRAGLYCVGCCWALMALLFVVGVMNLVWIAALTVFVLAEKLVPACWHLDHAAGLLLLAAGGWLAVSALG